MTADSTTRKRDKLSYLSWVVGYHNKLRVTLRFNLFHFGTKCSRSKAVKQCSGVVQSVLWLCGSDRVSWWMKYIMIIHWKAAEQYVHVFLRRCVANCFGCGSK